MSHHREVITATGAPSAVGPYSHAIKAGGLLFCSGQLALDPDSGELMEGTPAEEAAQCLRNLQAVCEAAGTSLRDAVRLTVLLADIDSWGDVNVAYAEFFPEDPPARVAYEVAALPKGAQVEIDAVVALPT